MDTIYGFLSLNLFSLIITVVISFLFFSKERLHQVEDKIYSFFIISNICATIFGIILGIFVLPELNMPIKIIKIVNKLYMSFLLVWSSLLTYYTLYISNIKNKNNQKSYIFLKKSALTLLIFAEILMLILPVNITISKNGAIASGFSLFFLYFYMAILLMIDMICIFKDFKNIGSRKYYPIYFLLILGGITITIQILFPNLNYLINPCTVLITFLMYHTIENPDVKMLEEVMIAKNNAERANHAKTEFLSSMSHEIRTPLNAIVGFSECILEEQDINKAKADAKDIIMASQNLLEIVNGILDISKIEADKMEIIASEYCLVDNMSNIAKLMIPRIGEKQVVLKTKFAKDIPNVLYGDIGKIKQIVTNLLTNAVKYTDKGLINFEINCVNKGNVCTMVISVEDTGRGIKPEKIDSIFNKFERLEEDRNTTLEGTGLGLAITKRLAEMMGGKVVVQSKYGSGSKFTVYLKQRIINKPTIVKDNVVDANEKFDCSGKRILVVDDNKINIKVATRLLEPYKVYISTCESGQDCINMASNELFDLILLDDMMPGMTGRETLVKLKEIRDFNVPVVALTANAIEGMKEEYLKLGFDDYLAKPIDKLELERVLRKILGNSKDVMKNNFEPLPNELFDMNVPLK